MNDASHVRRTKRETGPEMDPWVTCSTKYESKLEIAARQRDMNGHDALQARSPAQENRTDGEGHICSQ